MTKNATIVSWEDSYETGIVLIDNQHKELVNLINELYSACLSGDAGAAFREAMQPGFRDYSKKIVENCQALAESCIQNGLEVLTGGTDNHLILVNVRNLKDPSITGRQAESALHECNVTVNRNSLPNDPNGPWYTSGLRIGTAAITTLGMGKAEMAELGAVIALILKGTFPSIKDGKPNKAKYEIDQAVKTEALDRIKKLLDRFPVYPELDLELLKGAFIN